MARKQVTIPVSFELTKSAAAKVMQEFKKIQNIAGNESKPMIEKQLAQYASVLKNVEKIQPGQIISEQEGLKVDKILKDISGSFELFSREIRKAITKESGLEEMEEELKSLQDRINNMRKGLADSRKVAEGQRFSAKNYLETTGGLSPEAADLGFGRLKNPEKIIAKTIVVLDELKKKQQELYNTTPEEERKSQAYITQNDLLNKQITAVEGLASKAKEHQSAIDKEDIEGQAKRIEILNNSITDQKTKIDNTKKSIEEKTNSLTNLTNAQTAFKDEVNQSKTVLTEEEKALQQTQEKMESMEKTVEQSITRFFGLRMIFNTLKRVMRDSIRVIQELDKSFTEMAMVTTMSTKEVWEMKDAFVGIAQASGMTISEVSKIGVEFFRQGRSISETLKLTEAAAISARIANISGADSVRYLTSAINGFQLSASQAMEVSDKFASLAASSASSYEELATALSKVGA